MNVDPLAERFYSETPYNYCLNNPLFFKDPDGRLSESFLSDLFRNSGSGTTKWTNNNDGTFSGSNGKTISSDSELAGLYTRVGQLKIGKKSHNVLIVGATLEDGSSIERSYIENEHDMIQLPADNPDEMNGQFSMLGRVIYRYHNRNDMSYNGKVEQDQWGTAESLNKVIWVAMFYNIRFNGETISIGDISTETGGSPRYNSKGTRHKTHYNGVAFDFRYLTIGGSTSDNTQADITRTQYLMDAFSAFGFTKRIVGDSINKKINNATNANKGHNNHIHINY